MVPSAPREGPRIESVILAKHLHRAVCCVLIAALPASWVGCGRRDGPRWPAANQLVVAQTSSPSNLDPRIAPDAAAARVFELMLDGLVGKDTSGNLVPGLATSWEVLDGGRRYRFHLRSGVRFHDGRRLDAEDVAYTYRTLIDGSIATAKGAAFDRVERIETPDARTVDFVLHEPFGSFLVELTSSQGVIPAGTTPEAMNEHPIGTGPFRFVSRTPETVVLERFPDAWQGAPHLERVVLKEIPDATVRALELMKGSVQLVINDLPPDLIPHFREDPAYRVVEDPGAVYAYIGLNLTDPILDDVRVRRAMIHAIDRERLVDTLWRGLGVVTETMLPPGLWARHDDLEHHAYDPALARELLDEAGFADPPGPEPRFRLVYKTSTNEPYVLQAQIIQQMLAEVGIEVEISSQEFATFYEDVRKGNFQIFSLLRFGVIDPNIYDLVLHSRNVPPEGQNRGFYDNPTFDRLLEQAARLSDPAARKPLYHEIQEIFHRDLPYLSLYTRVNVAVMPAILEGYVNYPNGELYSLREMHWDRPGQRPEDGGPTL